MLDRVPHPQETISDGQITLNEACRKDHSPQEPAIVRDPRSRRRPAGGLDVPHPLAMSGQDRNARNHLLRIALPAGKGTSEWAGASSPRYHNFYSGCLSSWVWGSGGATCSLRQGGADRVEPERAAGVRWLSSQERERQG